MKTATQTTTTAINTPHANARVELKQLTDLCVKCGMCLPACPTYQLTRDESESPRGRIALIQGLVSGALELTPKLEQHLDHCVKCRSCERICPSAVPYGRIIDEALTHIERTKGVARPLRTMLLALATRHSSLRIAHRLAKIYQRCGARWIARRSGLLRALGLERAEALLPDLASPTAPWREYYPPLGTPRGDVALFTGCIAQVVDPDTTSAAIKVLTHFGYGVAVPPSQQCCGALHLHNQQPERAAEFAQANIAAFSQRKVIAILSTASGCAATLREYESVTHDPNARAFCSGVFDISEFLARIEWPSELRLRPLPAKVAVHDPCTLSNVLRASSHPANMLRRIPQLEVVPVNESPRCCGAAGSYMLSQPENADRLRELKLGGLVEKGISLLATSNVGCALHIAAGYRKSGIVIEVVHPVVLLSRAL